MANQRVKSFTGTGAVTVNIRFNSIFTTTLTGNTTLTIQGLPNGGMVEIYAKQDATGGRTFTIAAAPGGANVNIGTATAVNATANATTKIIIRKVNNVHNIVWAGGA